MATISPTVGELVWTGSEPIVATAPTVSTIEPGVWTAGIYEPDGTLVYDLTGEATLGVISEQLNAWATTDILIPKTNTSALAAWKPWARELHLYRNGVLEFGGPFDNGMNRSSSAGAVKLTASSWERHLSKRRREVPEAEGINLLKNPRFDDGLAMWSSDTGTPPALDALTETGTQAAQLSNGDQISQGVYLTDFLRGIQYTLRLALRVWLSSDCTDGPLFQLRDESRAGGFGGDARRATGYITPSTPREAWTTIAVDLAGPYDTPNVTRFVADLFWNGSGTVNVDHAHLGVIGLAETLGETYGDDLPAELTKPQPINLVQLSENLIRAQADLHLGWDTGQVALFAADQGSPQLLWEVLSSLTEVGDIDVGIVGTRWVRTVRVWPSGRGQDRDPDTVIDLGGDKTARLILCNTDEISGIDRTCENFSQDSQAGTGVNDLMLTGQDGVNGVAVDPSRFDGWKLQDVRSGPSGLTDRDQLNAAAASDLAREPRQAPVTFADVRGGFIDVVRLGDRVRGVASDGPFELDAIWRVMNRRVNPNTDRMDVSTWWRADP